MYKNIRYLGFLLAAALAVYPVLEGIKWNELSVVRKIFVCATAVAAAATLGYSIRDYLNEQKEEDIKAT